MSQAPGAWTELPVERSTTSIPGLRCHDTLAVRTLFGYRMYVKRARFTKRARDDGPLPHGHPLGYRRLRGGPDSISDGGRYSGGHRLRVAPRVCCRHGRGRSAALRADATKLSSPSRGASPQDARCRGEDHQSAPEEWTTGAEDRGTGRRARSRTRSDGRARAWRGEAGCDGKRLRLGGSQCPLPG